MNSYLTGQLIRSESSLLDLQNRSSSQNNDLNNIIEEGLEIEKEIKKRTILKRGNNEQKVGFPNTLSKVYRNDECQMSVVGLKILKQGNNEQKVSSEI